MVGSKVFQQNIAITGQLLLWTGMILVKADCKTANCLTKLKLSNWTELNWKEQLLSVVILVIYFSMNFAVQEFIAIAYWTRHALVYRKSNLFLVLLCKCFHAYIWARTHKHKVGFAFAGLAWSPSINAELHRIIWSLNQRRSEQQERTGSGGSCKQRKILVDFSAL